MTELVKVAIYLLCFATAAACAFLLIRGWLASRTRLLLWSGICFGFLALNAVAVILDIVVFPDIDFTAARHLSSLAAVSVLLVGLVWETE
jgi:hypothetical protein